VARARTAAGDDRLVRRLALLAGLAALGQHAGRAARVPAAGGPALATAHRVVDRVHRHAAVVRLAAQPAFPPGFTQALVHVLRIRDRADGRPAVGTDAAHLARGKGELRPGGLAGRQGGAAPGGSAEPARAARLHLEGVHGHAGRDAPQRQAVADLRLDLRAADDLVAGLQPVRGEDVRLGAVLVLEQGDAGRAVRVVLDRLDGGRHAV